jgi:AcrR family transcriptional regulator
MKTASNHTTRPYRQTARAAAAKATGERILDVFTSALQNSWFDAITLDEIAREAGVTVQTVIRRFGSKEGLLEAAQGRFGAEIRHRRDVPPGQADKAVAAIIEDYETVGDLIMRVLAQEERNAPLRAVTDEGRAVHRAWVGAIFAPWLDRMDEPQRTEAHDALVVATDLYVWKLIRRDMARPKTALAALMRRMIAAALGLPENQIFMQTSTETNNASR